MHDNIVPNKNVAPPPVRRHPRWMRYGCIVLIVLLLLAVAGVVAFRIAMKRNYADQWPEIQRAQSEVELLPAEWHQPAELPSMEIVEFAHDFSTTVTQIREKHEDLFFGDYSLGSDLQARLATGDSFSPEEETSLTQMMADLSPLLELASATAQRADYTAELDLWSDSSMFLTLQTFTKFASAAAFYRLRQGDSKAAIEIAALPLRLTRRPPQSYLVTHTICAAVSALASTALNTIGDQTTDTAALQRGLDLLTELQPTVFPGEMENWRYASSLGALRFAAANGYPVNLEPQPLVDYYEQSATKLGQHYSLWIVKNFPPTDPRAQRALVHLYHYQNPFNFNEAFQMSDENSEPLEGLAKSAEAWDEHQKNMTLDLDAIPAPQDTSSISYKMQEKMAHFLFGMHPYAYRYAEDLANFEEVLVRSKSSLALYELTRQNFALRLAGLNSPAAAPNATSPSVEDLTAYITELPDDPFRSAPFLYSDRLNRPYSIGPDKQDNKTEVVYDSTNGTVSAGDLWMKVR